MRILLLLASVACLISGCVLWFIGFQTAGTALAISSGVLVLIFSVVQPPEEESNPTQLETVLDWSLVAIGLGAFVITKDMFFLVSIAVVVTTSPGIKNMINQRTVKKEIQSTKHPQ